MTKFVKVSNAAFKVLITTIDQVEHDVTGPKQGQTRKEIVMKEIINQVITPDGGKDIKDSEVFMKYISVIIDNFVALRKTINGN